MLTGRRRFLELMTGAGVALAVAPVLARVPSTKSYFFGGFPETSGIVVPQLYRDGVHDDAPWLQWQMNNTRGPITIPVGTYTLGKPLQLTSGVTIIGSHFKAISDMNMFMTFPMSVHDITVTDCTFWHAYA